MAILNAWAGSSSFAFQSCVCLHHSPNPSHISATVLRSTTSSAAPPPRPPPPPGVGRRDRTKAPRNARSLEREIRDAVRAGRTDRALSLWRGARDSSSSSAVDVRCLNAALDACARARPPRVEMADALLAEVVASGRPRPNVFTFGALMSARARARDADGAASLLEEFPKRHGVRPNPVVHATAVSAAARAGRPDLALRLLDACVADSTDVTDRSRLTVAFNAAASALARVGRYERATRLLETDMVEANVPPNEVTYGTVMAACERTGRWREIMRLAEEVEERGLPIDGIIITTLLKACQRLALADEALRYMERFEGLRHREDGRQSGKRRRRRDDDRAPLDRPDDVAYCLAISACSRAGRVEDALRLLKRNRTVNAYTAVLQGYSRRGDYLQSLSLLREMEQDHGLEPNVVTYSTVISACANALANRGDDANNADNDRDEDFRRRPLVQALDLLREMEKRGVAPNVITYNAALRACAEARALPRALALADELRGKGLRPTVVTHGTLMTACERVGDAIEADRVFTAMRADGVRSNEIVYGAAISCHRKAGRPKRALALLKEMIEDARLRPNTATCNTVLVALTTTTTTTSNTGSGSSDGDYEDDDDLERRRRDVGRALRLYELMASGDDRVAAPDRRTRSILARAAAGARMPEEAERVLRDARVTAAHGPPDVNLYTTCVHAYERSQQPLKALRLMERMREEGLDFYQNQVLNTAFKKMVRLVNNFTTTKTIKTTNSENDDDDDEGAVERIK